MTRRLVPAIAPQSARSRTAPSGRGGELLRRRATWVVLGLGGLGAGALVWGTLIEPRLIDWVEEEAHLPRLPRAWEGRRVALIGDLQVGPWWANAGTIRRAVERLVRERPEAVLIAGDLIQGNRHDPADHLQSAIALLQPLLEAGIPVYAVLGNHDYLVGGRETGPAAERVAAAVRAALDAAGVRVLHNDAVPLPSPARTVGNHAPAEGETLYLVGLGPYTSDADDPQAAFAQLPPESSRIVLMHDPLTFRKLLPGAAPLAMAGHTHGGQVRIPFKPRWIPLKLVDTSRIYEDGWLEEESAGGNRLYVNRGLGFSWIPVRVGCPPEVTVFTLLRAPPSPAE